MSTMRNTIIVLWMAGLTAGCMTTRAHTPAERPALDVPPAPPRVVEAAPAPEPAPELVPDLPPEKVTPPPAKPRQSSPRELKENAKPEPSKPELPPAEPPPAQPPTQPPGPLRTQNTVDGATADRQVRDIIHRTQGILSNIDYKRLKPVGQSAYDQAKDSILGAETALKDKAFDLARQM